MTGFYWVLLGLTGFYWVLLGFIEFYQVLPSFIEFSCAFVRFSLVLPFFAKFYRVLPSFFEVYWLFYRVSSSCIGFFYRVLEDQPFFGLCCPGRLFFKFYRLLPSFFKFYRFFLPSFRGPAVLWTVCACPGRLFQRVGVLFSFLLLSWG